MVGKRTKYRQCITKTNGCMGRTYERNVSEGRRGTRKGVMKEKRMRGKGQLVPLKGGREREGEAMKRGRKNGTGG